MSASVISTIRVPPCGPHDAKIAILGEAPGAEEEIQKMPFVGAAGRELTLSLHSCGIQRSEVYITNVFKQRPFANNLGMFCVSHREDLPKTYNVPAIQRGLWVRPEYLPEVESTVAELVALRPNVIVALGNTALWALAGTTGGISSLRGTALSGPQGLKVIPTFHPAAVIRDYSLRPLFLADLTKAIRESAFPEIRVPHREIWLRPTLEDLELFENLISQSDLLSFDIETVAARRISCIALAPSKSCALVLPFIDYAKPGWSYWPSDQDELLAWRWLRRMLESNIPKLGQNGLYDIQHLSAHGINVKNYLHDTMLLHHAFQPELPKSLGFLGSIYTNEHAWKLMRPTSKATKRDE